MTSGSCLTGTDRVAEIAAKTNYKYYINLQGDEPVFAVEDLNKIINLTKLNKYEIINGYSEIDDKIKFKDINIPLIIHGGAGKINDIENLLINFKFSGVAISSAFHYHYLKSFEKNIKTSGNKEFFMGLRDKSEYNSFSLPNLKKIFKK